MLRTSLVLLISFFLVAPMAAAPDPADPSLQKPVTLAVKGQALSDVLSMIEKQTGVHIAGAAHVADQNVTVFVDRKPLQEVMDGLGMVFGYRLAAENANGRFQYTLTEPAQEANMRETAWKQAVSAKWDELDAIMRRRAAFKPDASEVNTEMDRLRQIAGNQPGNLYGDYDRWRTKRDTPLGAALVGDLAASRLYCHLSKTAMSALRSGYNVRFDSKSPDPAWRLPADVLEYLPQFVTFAEWAQPQISRREVVPWPPTWDEYAITLESEVSQDNEVVFWINVIPRKTTQQSPQYTPVYRHAISTSTTERWADSSTPKIPRKFNDPTILQQITITSDEISSEAQTAAWPSNGRYYANRSDMLALLHKKTGLQIISDHLTEYSLQENGNLLGTHPLQDALWQIGAPNAFWGWDGRYIYSAAIDPRYRGQQTIPKRTLQAWQTEYAKQGYLSLDTLGELAQLSRSQRGPLQNAARFLGLGSIGWLDGWQGFDNPWIRLYGQLSATQRKAALATGTPVEEFSTGARTALDDIMDGYSGLHWRANKAFGPAGRIAFGIYDTHWRRVDPPDDPKDVELEPGQQDIGNSKPVSLTINRLPGEAEYMMFLPQTSRFPQGPQPIRNLTRPEDLMKALASDPRAKTATVKRIGSEVYRFVVTMENGKSIDASVTVTMAPVTVAVNGSLVTGPAAPDFSQPVSRPPTFGDSRGRFRN